MKTVFLLGKRGKFSQGISRPVVGEPKDNTPWGSIITECEFIKETPKGWKLRPLACQEPRLILAQDSEIFDTAEEAAQVLREKLEAAKVVAQRNLDDVIRAIGECIAIEVEAE